MNTLSSLEEYVYVLLCNVCPMPCDKSLGKELQKSLVLIELIINI